MKKTLALVLALAMVFSTITVAFADEALSADTQACANLGMLKGETGTVDAAYAATVPNKIQAAVMLLRLKGLEEEAKAFTGEANFADADQVAWAKPIMAYLKANPQLGWVGDGTNFNPTQPVTAQMYYKVMLEALGYKQHTAEVIGDFTWENVIEFAASKGLTKVAAVTDFTINDLATATVEALKATVKEGGTTLAASLIEKGKIDAEVAKEAGIYTEVTTTEAALDTVFATANDKVEVGFDAEVDKSFAENAANFKITLKGSDTALEVKSAELASDPSFVVLTTAAQTGGAAYTLEVGAEKKNFAGVAKSTAVPELDTVKCIDTNTVEVVFKKAVDRASAEDVANYTLDKNATVVKAELWASQDDTRKTVKLTTEGVANSKVYTLKVQNVKSADLTAMKSASKSFTGITDTKAPTVKGAIVVPNNQRILVNFDDPRGIDKASAENLANWSIKDSAGNALNIISLKAVDDVTDDYSKYDQVEIATEVMNSGTKYTVTIENLSDDSVSKNVLAKALTKTFTGKPADKSAPTVKECKAISDTVIKVEFTDQNRLDNATLTNISNYTFAKDISVTDAKILRPTKPDLRLGKTVLLTTTPMDKDIKSYKLTITGVSDEFGNVMKAYNKSISYMPEDINPPYVKKVDWVDLNTVKLTFDDAVDSVTANDAANYTINNDLGTVRSAEVSGNDTNMYKVVTLKTPTMAENKKYTVTINGVKDLVGNATSDAKAYFTSERDGLDTERPEISTVDVVSKDEVRVTFDEPVKVFPSSSIPIMTVRYDSSGDGVIMDAAEAAAAGGSVDSTVTYTKKGQLLDDGTTMVFKSGAPGTTDDDSLTFRIENITFVTDKANNKFKVDTEDYVTFNGNSANNEPAEVDSIEQLDARTIVVVFDKPVICTGSFSGFTATVDVDGDDTNDAESTLTLEYGSPLVYDKTYTFNLSANVTDYMGDPVTDTETDTSITTTIDDQDGPVIEYVEAINTRKLQVHYNEDIFYAGTYKIYEDGKTTPISSTTYTYSAAVDKDDKTIVNITFTNGSLKSGEVYQIKPNSAAKDLANRSADTKDVEFSFVGSAVIPYDYIKGVTITDADTIRIYATADLPLTATVTNEAGKNIAGTGGDQTWPDSADKSYIQVELKTPLVDDEKYEVVVGTYSYSFVAQIDDGGISVDNANVITFSGSDIDDYVVAVVYENTDYYVKPVAGGFDATTNLYLYANTTNTPDISFATILSNSTQYVIKVYRTIGIADGTVAGSESWTAYKAIIDGNFDNSPYYTIRIKD